MRTQTDVIEPEWEVLPPEEKEKRARLEPLFRWVAIVMDELIAFPNTKFKFGLDPVIGLVPGIGDTASAIVSALVLIQAARRGVPKILLARMSLNILINEIVGDHSRSGRRIFLLVQYRTNAITSYCSRTPRQPQRARASDWLFVIVVLAALFIVVATGIFVSFLVLRGIAQLLGLH